jgi:monothiol glutaredoxin
MSLDPATKARIDQLVTSHQIVLFMKGTRAFPQCGFSATVVGILNELVPGGFETVNVLADAALREGVKQYSNWPTIPQLYIKGAFVGGCDIVRDLHSEGSLARMLGVEAGEVAPPHIELTAEAAAQLRAALEESDPGDHIHVSVDESWAHGLDIAPPAPTDLLVTVDEVRLAVKPGQARKLDGLVIRFVAAATGAAFKLENPNAPAAVKAMSCAELKALVEAGQPLHLIDVRTAREHAVARIEGGRLLDDQVRAEIEALDPDTPLVFYCHHGQRSRQAAEYFLSKGFRQVYNLTGGIDAWSRDVDPGVPRY